MRGPAGDCVCSFWAVSPSPGDDVGCQPELSIPPILTFDDGSWRRSHHQYCNPFSLWCQQYSNRCSPNKTLLLVQLFASDGTESAHASECLVFLAAHWPRYVLPNPPAKENLPDEPRCSEPAPEPPAGLDVWTLAHQLSRGAPPLPPAV